MANLKILWQLFWSFLKVGSFTFGGGLAMLPLIQKEVVDDRRWITDDEILDIFAIAQSVPGVIAINSAIYIGKKVRGVNGAISAAIGVIAPSFISIILILVLLTGYRDNALTEKIFGGIKAASAALILLSAIKLAKSNIRTKLGCIIGLASFAMVVILDISAAWAVVFGGVAGYLAFAVHRRAK